MQYKEPTLKENDQQTFLVQINIENEYQNIQPCPKCGNLISNIAGSIDAKCRNCGYKDGCCGS